jgi:hypothetical protein
LIEEEGEEEKKGPMIYKLNGYNNYRLIHRGNTTVYFYPNHIITTAIMSKIIIALVLAAICQIGTMGEEEKVSIKKYFRKKEHLDPVKFIDRQRQWILFSYIL